MKFKKVDDTWLKHMQGFSKCFPLRLLWTWDDHSLPRETTKETKSAPFSAVSCSLTLVSRYPSSEPRRGAPAALMLFILVPSLSNTLTVKGGEDLRRFSAAVHHAENPQNFIPTREEKMPNMHKHQPSGGILGLHTPNSQQFASTRDDGRSWFWANLLNW